VAALQELKGITSDITVTVIQPKFQNALHSWIAG